MSNMTDPMNALISLQNATNNGYNELMPCDPFPDIQVVFDRPNGRDRFTYVNIQSGQIQAFCTFVMVDPINETPCFNIGYAVPEQYRNCGLAKEIIEKSIAEISNGFARHNIKRLYIEAVIGTSNEYSTKLAERFISSTPEECTDSVSGLPALAYSRLIEL